jgi:hypothetical protein
MLYKHPGPHEIHGDHFDYTIVDDDEESVQAAIDEGWSLTTDEAKGVQPAAPAVEKTTKSKSKEKAPVEAGWGTKTDDANI